MTQARPSRVQVREVHQSRIVMKAEVQSYENMADTPRDVRLKIFRIELKGGREIGVVLVEIRRNIRRALMDGVLITIKSYELTMQISHSRIDQS